MSGLPHAAGRQAIVVVNYRSAGLLERNLTRSVDDSSDVLVIVVDNYSDAAERERVRALSARHGWTLCAQRANDGFGAAVNAGVRAATAAGATTVLLLNPDAAIDPADAARLHEACSREPRTATSPLITSSDGHVVYRGSQVSLTTGRIRGVRPRTDAVSPERLVLDAHTSGQLRGPVQGWLSGACLALTTSLFDAVGGFDETYFLYWEDVDLSARIAARGGSLVVRTDMVAVHDEGGTQQRAKGAVLSEHYFFYNCRNRLLFAARNLTRRRVLVWIACTPWRSGEIALRGGRAQLRRSVPPALRGSVAGVVLAVRTAFGSRRYSRMR